MRVAVLCPGRGSYTKKSLGLLPPDDPFVLRAEELRKEYGLVPLRELDRAPRFDPEVHLRAEHASPLIFLHTLLDVRRICEEHEVVCVGGNSMGWYTSLAVSGALSFDDGFRLVQELGLLQRDHQVGGQVVYPVIDEDWRADEELAGHVLAALEHDEAFFSIHLGGYAVLAGSENGVAHLLAALPRVERGGATYPFRLKGHGAYHTPLAGPVSAAAAPLMRLDWRAPELTLIDGRGAIFTPWSTEAAALAAYTLGAQIETPFDFTGCVRVALREFAPQTLALPGPENTLGGVCGQVLVSERWRGIDSRAAFDPLPEEARPVWSLRRT